MSKKNIGFVPLIAATATVFLFLGLDAPSFAKEGTMRFASAKGNVGKMVPFRDSGTWWYVGEGDGTLCDVYDALPVFVVWEGTGTHLGRFTGSEILCIDPSSGTLLAYSNQWTGANGDQLFGFGSIDEDPPVQMIYVPGASWEISGVHFVGGTGRFQGATGSVRYVGDHSLGATVGGTYAGEGWISFVGSRK